MHWYIRSLEAIFILFNYNLYPHNCLIFYFYCLDSMLPIYTHSLKVKFLSVTIQMKPAEQCFCHAVYSANVTNRNLVCFSGV